MPEDPPIVPYATSHTKTPLAPLATIRILSLMIGIASALFAAGGIVATPDELSTIRMEVTYRPDYEARRADAIGMGVTFAAMIAIALLLIFAARATRRSPRRAFLMFWIYVILQFIAGIMLGWNYMDAIYHSPGSMIFYIGAIPGLIACAYPTFLLIYLPVNAKKFFPDETPHPDS